MLAVVKTPHTNLRIQGDIPGPLLSVLKAQYGKKLLLRENPDDEVVNVFETDWYKSRKSAMTPGKCLRIYRENKDLTQDELGQKLGGLSRRYVSDLETGRRGISKKVAKALSNLFKQPIARFL
jgi:DNA-binding XRE family transcriptional regulator